MKKRYSLIVFYLLCNCPLITNSQTLGGYSLYGHLATAIHPFGCSDGYVTHFPDDSIWVNLVNDSTTGTFTSMDIDSTGEDLLLETGYNTSNYDVSLLLSNGQYSNIHSVTISDWTALPDITWVNVYPSTSCNQTNTPGSHYISSLDYNTDFSLISSDTVVGIKIIFLSTIGTPDLAGAYYIVSQPIGISEQTTLNTFRVFPNPFSDALNFTSKVNEMIEVTFFDITSRKLFTHNFQNSYSQNTIQLVPGIYFYEAKVENNILMKGRVVKY